MHVAKDINHEDCYKKFYFVKPLRGRKGGRPQEEFVIKAMEEIFRYLNENVKDQFSMDELMDKITGEKPQVR